MQTVLVSNPVFNNNYNYYKNDVMSVLCLWFNYAKIKNQLNEILHKNGHGSNIGQFPFRYCSPFQDGGCFSDFTTHQNCKTTMF